MRNKTTFLLALVAFLPFLSLAGSVPDDRAGGTTTAAVSLLANGNISIAEPPYAAGTTPPSGKNALRISRAGAANSELRVIVSDPALLGSPASVLSSSGERVVEIYLRHVNRLDTQQWPNGSYVLRLVDGRSVTIACR